MNFVSEGNSVIAQKSVQFPFLHDIVQPQICGETTAILEQILENWQFLIEILTWTLSSNYANDRVSL